MGQRMQVFIKSFNPLIKLKEEYKNTSREYWAKNKFKQETLLNRIKQYKNAFGEENTTIFSYHHQWLYGRSALLACINILSFAKNANEYNNPFSESAQYSAEDRINSIQYTLSLFNSRLSTLVGRTGLENFHILNFSEPGIREDFTRGDNNDGVILIDTINHKYAFINIGGDSTINQLPKLEPVSGERYVRLYYPQTEEDSKTVNLPEEQDIATYFRNNVRINKLFIKELSQYQILTKEEMRTMFPRTNSSLKNITNE